MCHQVIEKALKGVIARTGETPPYIHNLAKLAERAGLYHSLTREQKTLLAFLDPLNIEARYPPEKARSETLGQARCQAILEDTREFYNWIRAML